MEQSDQRDHGRGDRDDGRAKLPTYPRATADNGSWNHSDASASDFSPDGMLHATAEPPQAGWQRLLFRATRGLVNVGPGARELRELVAAVRAPITGCRRIAIVSRRER